MENEYGKQKEVLFHRVKILLLRQYITEKKIFLTVLLPRFSTLGSTGPVKKLKGGQIIREKSSSHFLDTVNSTLTQGLS